MAVADQIPLQSGFQANSTASEVLADLDLRGKTAIVTGGYSGIGLETVRALTNKGAAVIVPVRSEAKAQKALSSLSGNIKTLPMDLADLSSVRRFANVINGELNQLDLLINNAGIMACPEARVGPGWESQFGICHMGHFALTTELLPLLKNTTNTRVIALTSTAHKMSDILWDDIHFEKTNYDKWRAYGQAKTACALFANGLSRRLKDTGGLAFSVHPGNILTHLQRHLSKEEMIAIGWLDEKGELKDPSKIGFKTPEAGASTTLWAATSQLLDGKPGVYCEDSDIAEVTDPNSPMARFVGVDPHACNDEASEVLWSLSDSFLKAA